MATDEVLNRMPEVPQSEIDRELATLRERAAHMNCQQRIADLEAELEHVMEARGARWIMELEAQEQRIANLRAQLGAEQLLVEAWHGNSDDWQAQNERLRELLRELSEAAWPYAASQDGATDPRVGLVQPITVAQGIALQAALKKADEALEEK